MDTIGSLPELQKRAREECEWRGILYAERTLIEGGEFIPILRRLHRGSMLKLGAITLFVFWEVLLAFAGLGGDGGGVLSPTLHFMMRLLLAVVATVMWVQVLREVKRCDALVRALHNDEMSTQ